MVGGLYEPGDVRRDKGFTIFYIGINIGAFLAGITVAVVCSKMGLACWVWTRRNWNGNWSNRLYGRSKASSSCGKFYWEIRRSRNDCFSQKTINKN